MRISSTKIEVAGCRDRNAIVFGVRRLIRWCGCRYSERCHDGGVNEADNVAEWARLMASRYDLGNVDQLIIDGSAMTVAERAEFQVIFEKLAYLEAMAG